MQTKNENMVISKLWFQASILTFLIGFSVLVYLAIRIYWVHPPIPQTVIDPHGRVLFTGDDIRSGQQLFQKYGLMEYGTIFGHGAYLGPDFTAQHLHLMTQYVSENYQQQGMTPEAAQASTIKDFKAQSFDPAVNTLTLSAAQSAAHVKMLEFYTGYFGADSNQGLRRPRISDTNELRQIAAYFTWAAWVSAATRPGADYSYTNNWPPESRAGNMPTADAFIWSVLSIISLLGGTGLVLFAVGRWDILGWHRATDEQDVPKTQFRLPENVALAPAQRATAWYFLVVSGLFLAQGLVGGAAAHYHVEPGGFYGFDLAKWFPYNLTRMWHVQLALFWITSSFLAMGIFIAPMIAGREPRHQEKFAMALFGALVVVVVGSLLGEAASIHNLITANGPWFWLGTQGWEYLDLGRLWQILLAAGLVLWFLILLRGLWSRLRGEHHGNIPYLFVYSSLSIPLFYSAGLLFGRESTYAVVDFWRFWVVHLWVEDFLELFTTITVASIFVLIGIVSTRTATRVIYLDIVLYSMGGVIGTMHHLYFSGAPAAYMALGAMFSAMEVIPLMLLTFEAWRFMRLGGAATGQAGLAVSYKEFPHKWAVMFLIAVGFWNFVGAGIFGFLINLPIVSYYEIGTAFTANHGHGALMGVYGMLGIGFFMFVARYFIPPDRNSERAMKLSFWGLNIGLAWMLFVNLVPLGIVQLYDSFKYGYWHARQPEFFQQPLIRAIEWHRLPGDAIFIVFGILPVVYLAIRMWANRNRYRYLPAEAEAESLMQRKP
ncbi:MAG: cbb3-type cytochrome c oxidase subunit I [Candidatus Hydrogenedentes bacterium]|nr:cbb3-type cytochrome c oxidase subunit I [Candidatus Hydrogenedentota bacterium]